MPANKKIEERFFFLGCVFVGVSLSLLVVGFFLENLSPDQRQLLRYLCAISAGFAAAFITGTLNVEAVIPIPGWPAKLAVSGGSGFGMFLIIFFFLFPADSNTVVRIRNAETRELIRRPFTVSYLLDAKKDASDAVSRDGWGGSCRIPKVDVTEIKTITALRCAGYVFDNRPRSISTDPLGIIDVFIEREPGWYREIIPYFPETLCWNLPSDLSYRQYFKTPEVCATSVELTCKNDTGHCIDVFLYHYAPPGLSEDYPCNSLGSNLALRPSKSISWLQLPKCKDQPDTFYFDSFTFGPGGYIVFLSRQGRPPSHGHFVYLYDYKDARIRIFEDRQGNVRIQTM